MGMPYLNATRTEDGFVEAVKALVATTPDAAWTFVCDGLDTHKSEALARFVAQACVPGVDLGIKGKTGILKSMESRAEFLHVPLVLHHQPETAETEKLLINRRTGNKHPAFYRTA